MGIRDWDPADWIFGIALISVGVLIGAGVVALVVLWTSR